MKREEKLLVGGTLANRHGEVVDNEFTLRASSPGEAVKRFLEVYGIDEYCVLEKESEGHLLVFRVSDPKTPSYWWGGGVRKSEEGSMRHKEVIAKDFLTLYGEVLVLGKGWAELDSQMGRVRVQAPPKRLEELEEGQMVELRVLARVARRRGKWELLGRPEVVEVLRH